MKTNVLAIIAVVVLDMVLGMIWYSPFLFGEVWHSLQGLDMAEMQEGRGAVYGISLLGMVVKFICLALLLQLAKAETWRDGIRVSLLAWLGFVVTIHLGSTLFADRSLEVLLINMSFHLIVFTSAGAILTTWRKKPAVQLQPSAA